MISKEDFEKAYAERGGISIEQLREWGKGAVPCDCGEPQCEGWAMVNLADHADHLRALEAIAARGKR